MSVPQQIELVDALGMARSVQLGALLASGGAGSVYSLKGDPQVVVKLYHPHVLSSQGDEYRRRTESMLNLRPNLPDVEHQGHRHVQLAWPSHLAHLKGRFVGFAMPALEMSRTRNLELAINEKQAARCGIRTDLGARVTLARQLAGVVAALHAREHYVIDLKPINIHFYTDVLFVVVLDCDGFNIHDRHGKQHFPAPQYTPDYLAPEFQHQASDPNRLPEQQDCFALAVILFQLLNHGIHPYAGRLKQGSEPSSLEGRIARAFYPFGTVPHRAIEPPAGSAHECLPDELRTLFDRAFGPNPDERPTAQAWRDTLDAYASPEMGKLVRCSTGHLQFSDMTCGTCMRAGMAKMANARPAPAPQPPQTAATLQARGQNIVASRHLPPLFRATAREKFYGVLAVLCIPTCLMLLWYSIGGAGNYKFVFFVSMLGAGCVGYLVALNDGDPERFGNIFGFMVVLGLPLFLLVGGIKYGYTWPHKDGETDGESVQLLASQAGCSIERVSYLIPKPEFNTMLVVTCKNANTGPFYYGCNGIDCESIQIDVSQNTNQ